MLYPYRQPHVTGRNNQLIEFRNVDGSFNQAIFLIDSNAYTEGSINSYDYIHDDQVDWYQENIKRLEKQERKAISSMLFSISRCSNIVQLMNCMKRAVRK